MTLIEALQTILDHRRGAGRRYLSWVFLLGVFQLKQAWWWGKLRLRTSTKAKLRQFISGLKLHLSRHLWGL
ncbi:MAG: hypothetical protein HC895_24845 [Leptolyngbyaceae cyanobacterium SM1_3_5]|nr:hypothetical protein [Leptolyngbyaceae cyanobacterium SM1_3_5]